LTMGAHHGIECLFSCVTERRVPYVMHQRQRFHQVHIQPKLPSYGSSDLRHLNGVSKPVAEVIGVALGENLSFILKATERARMDNTITIPFEFISVRVSGLGVSAATRCIGVNRVFSQHRNESSSAAAKT
jgi:hypothetical protein